MRNLFIVLTISLAVGCQSKNDQTNTEYSDSTSTVVSNDTVKTADQTAVDLTGCYMQVLKRDTFAIILKQQGNALSGRLSFDNYEKDGSTGSITGKMEAGVLKLIYSFASEGMNSIMEVYFKYSDNTLTRGIGEMSTKGDSAYFVNPASIIYNGSVLTKMSCDNLPDKYK